MHNDLTVDRDCRPRSSMETMAAAADVEAKKAYVAVGRDDVEEGKALMSWAAKNFPTDVKLVILHVHAHEDAVSIGLAMVPACQLEKNELCYTQLEKQEMKTLLSQYMSYCTDTLKVQAETLVIESVNVASGIAELIKQHQIRNLVMGASDYSKNRHVPKSGIASAVHKVAPPFCKIFYICNKLLACTREASQDAKANTPPSSTASTIVDEHDLRSVSLPPGSSELKEGDEPKTPLQLQIECLEHTFIDLKARILKADGLIEALQKNLAAGQCKRDDAVGALEEVQVTDGLAIRSHNVLCFRDSTPLELQEYERVVGHHGLELFTSLELAEATNNFDNSLKVGEGGYGPVYKGFLRHTNVGIKILSSKSIQGQSEFISEVEGLGRLRHPNIVTLMGACKESYALVYEFMQNGSLGECLCWKHPKQPLQWISRMSIASQICSALVYIHSSKPNCIVHGDVKPANILLDSSFTAKLGDFGTSHMLNSMSSNSTQTYKTCNPIGTLAYMDREFLTTGKLTAKSDVYAFGIVLLQLLTGIPPMAIAREVEEALRKGCLQEVLDKSAGKWPLEKTKEVALVALRCCSFCRRRRPDLANEVWPVLQDILKVDFQTTAAASSSLGGNSKDSNFIPPVTNTSPLTEETISESVIAADGFPFELGSKTEDLKGWLDRGVSTTTYLKLSNSTLVPNYALRSAVQDWLLNKRSCEGKSEDSGHALT